MKQLLVLLILLSSFTVSGQRKFQFSLAGTTHLSKENGTGLGVHVNASRFISPQISAGLSVDMVRFQQLGFWETPIAASLQLKATKAIFLRLEPGYVLLNKNERGARGLGTITEGGFYVFGGMGYLFPVSGKFKPVVSIGATRFNHAVTTFEPLPNDGIYSAKSNKDFYSFSLRFGIMLH